jgi:hypothetical protein
MGIWRRLLADDRGFLVSSELALVSTLGVLGLTAGLADVSQDVNGELVDVGGAMHSLDQSYSIPGPGGQLMQYRDAGSTRMAF